MPIPPFEQFPLQDGELYYYPEAFRAESQDWFDELRQTINWQQSEIRLFGKKRLIPRLNAWYGDAGAGYRYSGITMNIEPWLPALLTIRQRVQLLTGCQFNSVLANYYRDGRDSVAWHSDDESELGCNPVIASVSLGVERIFMLRPKPGNSPCRKAGRRVQSTMRCVLANGSLLLMKGALQHHWQHQVPKVPDLTSPRLSLTFRLVETGGLDADRAKQM